jgi:DNA-binding NarL/FixJ family response regulator
VILVTGFDTPEYVERALEVGAKGYVLKDAVGDDLPKAIHAIHRGSEYFSEKIAQIATAYLASKGNNSSAA